MKVELMAYTHEGELVSAMAAKLTHYKGTIEDLKKSDEGQLRKILRYVIKVGHESVIEHAYFTFAISDVSRSLTHQLVRHRIASYSQQSQRYVENEMDYVVPPLIKRAGMEADYRNAMEEMWGIYDKFREVVPVEDARYVLPNAACTQIMVSMNARSLLNFFELRCCLHAQWEIRALAWKMLGLVKKVAPVIFENAGPPCKTRHVCPMENKECRWYPGSRD
ncbi:MAG: FAD-dependent thymidylate synthase [Thermoplasmata archaeon]|nr:FAD-dependent thymidylate synthase [Thermoplasmata archaeon]